MESKFDIVERTYYRKDRFDIPLDSYLLDAVEQLRMIVRGEHPIWRIVVWDLLTTYLTRFNRLYNFKLSYGYEEKQKSKRQIDYEKHIGMLEHTSGRLYISTVCIEALRGHGWTALERLRKWKWKEVVRPRFIFFQLLSFPMRSVMRLYQKMSGAFYALEILGLFKSLENEEVKAILDFLEKETDDWHFLYVVNVLSRPGMIRGEQLARLERLVFSKHFERADILQQVLARLARISSQALKELEKIAQSTQEGYPLRITSDALEYLISAAAVNPDVMRFWLEKTRTMDGLYSSLSEEKLQKSLCSVNAASLQVVFSFAETTPDRDTTYIETIFKNIRQLTSDAQELLSSFLRSDNPKNRYWAACVMLGLASPEHSNIDQAFEAILEITLGHTNSLLAIDSYQGDGDFRTKVLGILLDLSCNRRDLLKKLLISLRDRWSAEFQNEVRVAFAKTKIPPRVADTFADSLRLGDIDNCRRLLTDNVSNIEPETYNGLWAALKSIQGNEAGGHLSRDENTHAEMKLSRAILDYASRIKPFIVVANAKLAALTTSNYLVIPALLCLVKPERNSWNDPFYYDRTQISYLSIFVDIRKTIDILNSSETGNTLLVDTIGTYLATQYSDLNLVIKAASCFPKPDKDLYKLIYESVKHRTFERNDLIALATLPRLDQEGVSLIVQSIVNDEVSSAIVENPRPVDPTGAKELIKTLKTLKELTENEVLQLWIFAYAIKALNNSSAITEDVVNICKDIVLQKISIFEEGFRGDIRPFAVWALGKVRPVRSDILDILKKVITSKPSRVMAYGHFRWSKVVAIVALAEMGSDITNSLSWEEREDIADMIIKYVKIPFVDELPGFFGGENAFPYDPSDAIYDAACMIVRTMRMHWSRVDYTVELTLD